MRALLNGGLRKMPKFFELYGKPVAESQNRARNGQLDHICPYTNVICDGGGNRHQTKLSPDQRNDTSHCFLTTTDRLIPSVCSIDYGAEQWVVCPRRLFGFVDSGSPPQNQVLHNHEREALLAMGLPPKIPLGIWSEVYLKYSENEGQDETVINYHFDYVVVPIEKDVLLHQVLVQNEFHASGDEKTIRRDLRKAWGNNGSKEIRVPYSPDASSPVIIEVMTASTSGSNRQKGTDIASSFCKALLNNEYQCPGINKRQVWGRMATQLFAKTALAESWGGQTYWLIQEQFLRNIEETTRLNLSRIPKTKAGNINFGLFGYGNESQLGFNRLVEATSGIEVNGSDSCVDILLPKMYPPKKELLRSLLRNRPVAIVTL
jgi:hypothetical protein